MNSHGAQGVEALIIPFINFAVFAAILFYFTRKQVVEFFKTREKKLRDEFENSQKRYESAEKEIDKLKHKIASMEEEKKTIMEQYRQKSETVQTDIMNAAKKEAEDVRLECGKIIDAEIDELKKKIIGECTDSVLNAVEKRAASLSDEKKEEMRKEFIELLGRKA